MLLRQKKHNLPHQIHRGPPCHLDTPITMPRKKTMLSKKLSLERKLCFPIYNKKRMEKKNKTKNSKTCMKEHGKHTSARSSSANSLWQLALGAGFPDRKQAPWTTERNKHLPSPGMPAQNGIIYIRTHPIEIKSKCINSSK